jgi:hypothetical protein
MRVGTGTLSGGGARLSWWTAWVCLVLLLFAALPLFLCLPLCADATLYDLCARNLLRGGVHYRDTFDTNLPGMVWLHAAIRGLCGWRFEVLRAFDLLFFAATVGFLVHWINPAERPRAVRVWTAFVLCLFYLLTPETCHCQRDCWALAPALLALTMRRRYLEQEAETAWPVMARAGLEGICWGIAVWIKPFVFVPALCCWIFTAAQAWHTRAARRALWADALGLLAGGVTVGALGLAWLWASGAWPYCWEVLLEWNPEYLRMNAHVLPWHWRLRHWGLVFFPWSLVHFLAVPVALTTVWLARKRRLDEPARALGAVFYLGWLTQALTLQVQHDYVLCSTVLPALGVLAAWGRLPGRGLAGWAVVGLFFGALALFRYPVLGPERMNWWGDCWRAGSTPEVRDALALSRGGYVPTDWHSLEAVAVFLQGQGVGDGELTCMHDSTHPLYLRLGVEPSTRYFEFNVILFGLPSRHAQICRELSSSRQHWVVADLLATGLPRAEALKEIPGGTPALPPAFPKAMAEVFPWNEPVVFRAGRYTVHKVTGPVEAVWPKYGAPTLVH